MSRVLADSHALVKDPRLYKSQSAADVSDTAGRWKQDRPRRYIASTRDRSRPRSTSGARILRRRYMEKTLRRGDARYRRYAREPDWLRLIRPGKNPARPRCGNARLDKRASNPPRGVTPSARSRRRRERSHRPPASSRARYRFQSDRDVQTSLAHGATV